MKGLSSFLSYYHHGCGACSRPWGAACRNLPSAQRHYPSHLGTGVSSSVPERKHVRVCVCSLQAGARAGVSASLKRRLNEWNGSLDQSAPAKPALTSLVFGRYEARLQSHPKI